MLQHLLRDRDKIPVIEFSPQLEERSNGAHLVDALGDLFLEVDLLSWFRPGDFSILPDNECRLRLDAAIAERVIVRR